MSAFVGNVSASQTASFRSRQPLRPARRGQRKCLCNGVLHETKGHYGWILPTDDIEHMDAQKHQGGIYLDTRDIRPGSPLVKGDEVKFYLYADSRGLGAEDCHLKVQPSVLKPKPSGNFTLSLADLLDGDIENKEDVQKKPKAEGSDTASTASGTRSGPSSPRADFENDPILRMLLQPRMKMSKPEMKLSTDSIFSDTASTAVDSNSSSHSSPETVLTEPSSLTTALPGEQSSSSADLDEADLFATLRSELRAARARAESLTTKTAEPTAAVPAGFRAPPGLLAPPGLPAPKSTVTKAEAAFADLAASLGLAGADIEPPPGLF